MKTNRKKDALGNNSVNYRNYLQGPSVLKTCGVIAARAELSAEKVDIDFTAVHCAPSMGFAYFHKGMKSPLSRVDRTRNSSTAGSEEVQISVFGLQTSWTGNARH